MANKYEVESLTSYIEIVQELVGSAEFALFRGQRKDWKLVPKMGRVRPKNGLVQAEKEMLASLKRRFVQVPISRPENELEWLALAQHHGMATRLLDWTENPLAALWFAVRKCPMRSEEGHEESGVVWCLPASGDTVLAADDPQWKDINPFQKRQTVVFRPRHFTQRIVAQSGWFTLHAWLDDKGKFIPLEENKNFKDTLSKVVIPPTVFPKLRRLLEKMNVHDATLFPDLGGLCDQIERDHTVLDDEVPKPRAKPKPIRQEKTARKA